MSSQLPVPSKAALTALRGLIVGTSCTLVLVTEDRRRRINAARSAIQNGERLKSARQYHTGGAALALALEEEALIDQNLISWTRQNGSILQSERGRALAGSDPDIPHHPTREQGAIIAKGLVEHSRKSEKATRGPLTPGRRTEARAIQGPDPFILPLSEKRIAMVQNALTKGTGDRGVTYDTGMNAYNGNLSLSDVLSRISVLCESRDPRKVEDGVKHFYEAFTDANGINSEGRTIALQASARLCRACRELGLGEEAAGVLQLVIRSEPLDEDDYYRHEPLAVIESILPPAEMEMHDRSGYVKQLDICIDLFLPGFASKPRVENSGVMEMGMKLLERAFTANHLKRIDDIYWRVLVHHDNCYEFIQWFIKHLHDAHQHKSAIKYYLLCYAKTIPSKESFSEVVDVIVDSVTAGHNYKAEQVLKKLMAADLKLKTAWVIKLLHAHWRRYRDIERTTALFETVAGGLDARVAYPDGVYRIMIEIALEDGDHVRAQQYFSDLVDRDASSATDVRLLGLFALSKARLGDWEGVRADFSTMRVEGRAVKKAHGEVFVPVLKQYARQHSIGETEEFLREYIEDLHVPVDPYMVGLMAHEYAAIRDVRSFTNWLEYCAHAGFPVDAAFSNAILTSCRTRWKFPFRDLRTIFRKLRGLSPSFANEYTERVMVKAALSDCAPASKVVVAGRLASLRVKSSQIYSIGKCARQENIVPAMSQAIKTGNPAYAVQIYKRSIHLGMPLRHGLHLAVLACLQRNGKKDSHAAISLLRAAQESGEDISMAINPLLDAHLSEIDLDAGSEAVFRMVRAVLQKFEDGSVKLNDFSLNRAALYCLRGRHFNGAITFALAASQASGRHAECYNVFNFGVLLAAYTELRNVKAIKSAVEAALASEYCHDIVCLRALKHSRRRLRRFGQTEEIEEAQEAVRHGIQEVLERRKQLDVTRKQLSAETIRVMQQAAVDAGYAHAGFDDLPWLREASVPGQKQQLAQLRPEKEESGKVAEIPAYGEVVDGSPEQPPCLVAFG